MGVVHKASKLGSTQMVVKEMHAWSTISQNVGQISNGEGRRVLTLADMMSPKSEVENSCFDPIVVFKQQITMCGEQHHKGNMDWVQNIISYDDLGGFQTYTCRPSLPTSRAVTGRTSSTTLIT